MTGKGNDGKGKGERGKGEGEKGNAASKKSHKSHKSKFRQLTAQAIIHSSLFIVHYFSFFVAHTCKTQIFHVSLCAIFQ
jgi:hypothetical protein